MNEQVFSNFGLIKFENNIPRNLNRLSGDLRMNEQVFSNFGLIKFENNIPPQRICIVIL